MSRGRSRSHGGKTVGDGLAVGETVGVGVGTSAPRTIKSAVVEHAGHTADVHVCLHQASIDLSFDEEHVVVIWIRQ